MMKVNFNQPVEFEQEGFQQKGMFLECNYVRFENNGVICALLHITESDFAIVDVNHIKSIE